MALMIKQANSGKNHMYDEYVQLLAHAASDYDNVQIKAKAKRQVYLHGINEATLLYMMNLLLIMNPLTTNPSILVLLLRPYKPML
jgi:hypothetical protein